MSTFRISQPATGALLGAYTADTKAGALAMYARDAGYDSFVALCEVTGDNPDDDGGLRVQVMRDDFDVTDEQIEKLRTESAEAEDFDMVGVCTVALADGAVRLDTAKGSTIGSVRDVCRWQAEYQGAAASISGLDLSGVDFDPDDIRSTILAVRNAARARCAEVIADAKAAGE